MYLTTLTATIFVLVTSTAAQNICAPGSIGVGIAPSIATDTYSLIVDSTCGVIDSRVGHGELCGTYNQGSEVECVDDTESAVASVVTSDGVYGDCVAVREVCYVQPGFAIQWCCGV
ncbi:hypothetical protein BDW74DRAFT_173291 [Aspergillus multicolor]|uniref:uncharacterized protein n=1 Tax=Aspergillus multicolor TaxID=41759 RepID=UPI003CCD78F8